MSSPAPSTRSSRASTPADEDSPAILSPRSRLQKLLAPFDEDSDDETPIRPNVKPTKPTTASTVTQSTDATARVTGASQEKHDDDEDEPIFKPRGRLAARMAGAAAPIQQESGSSEDEDEDVYSRIKRDLMAKKKATSDGQQELRQTNEEVAPSESRQTTPPRKRLLTRTQRASTPASTRSESPGLFMSPAPNSRHSDGNSSDDSLPDMDNPTRLRELVNRRRADRLAKEQAEREAEEERAQSGQAPLSDLFDDEDQRDENTERRLTQHAKPTRKASKKALEEMNRETQRMKRNMQLTHQAKVKKRFTAQDFLSTFNRPKNASSLANITSAAEVTSSSPPPEPMSDATAGQLRDTPPSSPPSASEDGLKPVPTQISNETTDSPAALSDEELPTLEEVMAQPKEEINKAKASALHAIKIPTKPNRRVRVVPPKQAIFNRPDDDLQIVSNRFAMFDEVPSVQNSEAKTMLMLRHLAHISNPEKTRLKKGQKPSMTPGQLELQLRQRARDIANQERAERLAELRAKGVIVMTEEEREREQLQIEDMLTRARQEADDLRKKEKASAKAAGEADTLSSDESDDADYAASDEEGETRGGEEEDGEDEEIELSGSEEEDNIMIDVEADEEDEDNTEQQQDHEREQHTLQNATQDEDLTPTSVPQARRARRKHIIEDDEEEEDDDSSPKDVGINDELAAAFGFGPAPTAPMAMSQMFAGTMENSQTQIDTQNSDLVSQEQDSLELLRHIPSAPIPTYDPSAFLESQDAVLDSQTAKTEAKEPTQQVEFNFTQPALDSPSVNRMSQFSEIPDPSQDVGLAPNHTPLMARAIDPSTADTVMLGVPESPVVQKRGRLLRRSEMTEQPDDMVPSTAPAAGKDTSDAFAVMRQAAKKPVPEDFNKKKSNAKTMVDEQAEESEDEFAGIGGASDDESGGEADEADRQMIDESDVKVDERQLAAFYAEKARAQDEVQTSKLYKDLMSGALRRKRGNAFELDSDEDDQIVERRRRKQREEARKRKLLLQDETVGKLGANEKKEAFLRAIEDRDSADELDFLDGQDVDDDDTAMQDSQPIDSQQGEVAPLSQVSGNTLKRPSDAEVEASQPRKKSSTLRRSQWESFKKPKSLAEVRESVSFLIDEPNGGEELLVTLSDSEREDEAVSVAERAPAAERRTAAKADIIDRLTLKKQNSTTAETTSADGMAFEAPGRSFSSFKAPSLLRKATTGLSSDSIAMPPPALGREDSGVRRSGSKKSSINYQAREAERRVIVERAERRRKDNVKKIAGLRRKSSALGMLGNAAGGFE